MRPSVRLALSGVHYRELQAHLYPGDGKEALAFALCGRASRPELELLLVRELILVPYEDCITRTAYQVEWNGTSLERALTIAASKGLALVKVHSHPTGFPAFSQTDDESEALVFPTAYSWLEDDRPLASAVMLPDGEMFGRAVWSDGQFQELEQIRVAGDDFKFWGPSFSDLVPEEGRRIAQAFGDETYQQLRRLTFGVVGASGTGSLTIEQLARNNAGGLRAVDPDVVEKKNLNRIVNTTKEDALSAVPKVTVAERAIKAMGLGAEVRVFKEDLLTRKVLEELSTCDVLFGCVDSIEARHVLNKLSTYYLIPFIDMGVRLDADGKGNVESIWINVHTLQPGGSSLKSRGFYDAEDLKAAAMYRANPEEYKRLRKDGYIRGVDVDSPAVISVNMMASAMAVNEFLARLHGFRVQPNSDFAARRVCLTDADASFDSPDGEPCKELARFIGAGDQRPFLGILSLEA